MEHMLLNLMSAPKDFIYNISQLEEVQQEILVAKKREFGFLHHDLLANAMFSSEK